MEIPKTNRHSRTLCKYGRRISIMESTEFAIVIIAFVGVAIAALSNFAIYGVNSNLADVFSWTNIKKWTLILTLMFISSVALMYFFVWFIKRSKRETGKGTESR